MAQRTGFATLTIALLMAAVIGLQAARERSGDLRQVENPGLLYVRSTEAMNRLALSYNSLLADIYWIRAVQHYGSTKLSTNPDKQYNLLYPLLDLTTSLDPRFNIAYQFGAIFLSELPPRGPGRHDLAIALLEKGLRAQPARWQFAQLIGFIHYWWREDYTEAAAWFRRAAEFPDAPLWLETLAAATLAEGGRRESSRMLWQQIAEEATDGWFRSEAERRLQQLDAMDHLDRLGSLVRAFAERYGSMPRAWSDLVRAHYLQGIPVDPTGVPYILEPGRVTLSPESSLAPLPDEPAPRG